MYLVIYPDNKYIAILDYNLSSVHPNHTFISLPDIRTARFSLASSQIKFFPVYSFSEKLSRLICADVSLDLLEEYSIPIDSILKRWGFSKNTLLDSLEDKFSEKARQE